MMCCSRVREGTHRLVVAVAFYLRAASRLLTRRDFALLNAYTDFPRSHQSRHPSHRTDCSWSFSSFEQYGMTPVTYFFRLGATVVWVEYFHSSCTSFSTIWCVMNRCLSLTSLYSTDRFAGGFLACEAVWLFLLDVKWCQLGLCLYGDKVHGFCAVHEC